jgi:cytochrome c peroxidase
MKRPLLAAMLLGIALPVAGPAAADLDSAAVLEDAKLFFEPIPLAPPVPEGNVLSRARIDLGKTLFFDPRLSRSWVFSCNSCHNVGMGGVDGLETSIGHGWEQGPRNSPTVFNAIFNAAQFWDGRAADLREQATGPIEAAVEMNNTEERVLATLGSMSGYVDLFATAFPGEEAPISFNNVAKAIEAFEATLITPNSRFDQFLMGDTGVLDAQELRGLQAFIDQGCITCHQGVNLGGQEYYPFGLNERPGANILPPGDRGRFDVTRTAIDDYVFRAAPLRNIALTPPYFHSGAIWDLETAVAVMGVAQLGAELTQSEIEDITAFLRTLNGEVPEVDYPVLPEIGPDTPLPEPM